MTKKEILKFFELKIKILEFKETLPKIKNMYNFFQYRDWFPEILELNNEFELLKKELDEQSAKLKEQLKTIEENIQKTNEQLKTFNTSKCSHNLRFKYSDFLFTSSECIFCGKKIDADNVRDCRTLYNDSNRNKNCVFIDGGYYDEDRGFIPNYTLKKVYEIIKELLIDKKDDDEINLLQEFKKLNLKDIQIDERPIKKEYHILIIGGSNKYYISDTEYITSERTFNSVDIAYYLSGIPKVKVELFDNIEIKENRKFDNTFLSNIKTRFDSYKTIDELLKKIENEKDVPFDIIIDMSTLFEYKDNKVIPYNIDLKKRFPNAYIVKIGNYSLKMQLEFLKEKLNLYNDIYNQINDKQYSHLKKDLVETISLNETCKRIRMVLK